MSSGYPFNIRSKGHQRSELQGHKVHKHTEGGRLAGVNLHSIEWLTSSCKFALNCTTPAGASCTAAYPRAYFSDFCSSTKYQPTDVAGIAGRLRVHCGAVSEFHYFTRQQNVFRSLLAG